MSVDSLLASLSEDALRLQPSHAFHLNLPAALHRDSDTNVPYITTFAHRKARKILGLVQSIQLSEALFVEQQDDATASSMPFQEDNGNEDEMDWDIEDGDEEEEQRQPPQETIQSFTKKCARLQSQLSGLEALKYSGMTQRELCVIVLHLLKLVTCTVEIKDGSATLYYENVGDLRSLEENMASRLDEGTASTQEELGHELERPFALHSPAREVLLLVLINILSNKGPLRSVSNASIYTKDTKDRSLLVLNWKVLLRTMLRTAPYLDERKNGVTKSDSNQRQTVTLKRTVQLIRDARHFFDQGLRPDNTVDDHTARQVWEMVQTDVSYHSHTHACYRGTVMLYLFLPSRCSQEYYLEVMPKWLECWTNIDRCPEYDFLWLALFCRARKHFGPKEFEWGPIRKRLLTLSQYWLQLPIGGAAMDKSFPRAQNPRSRSCPPRLKVFTGTNSSYEEGIDFVAKVVKLLVTSIGTGELVEADGSDVPPVSEGTADILRFLSFVTPYFNPSNIGSWTFTLGAFLHYFAYELCCRVGAHAGMDALRARHPDLVVALETMQPGEVANVIPAHEIVLLMDALLPLCQQAIYSKNGHVGRAGEAAMLYLVQIDPVRAAPPFIDFATRALDISAVNLAHQAPAALSALTRLVQPALRTDPAVLLLRLPDILGLSLAGIDSNDQNKTIRTLLLYRSLTSWLPIGGNVETWVTVNEDGLDTEDGTLRLGDHLFDVIAKNRECPEYLQTIGRLPETSLLKLGASAVAGGSDMRRLALEEAAIALSDWALEFLDRVFGLLRASGEREKAGKTASGVATRHSTADVHQARNFSRVLTESLMQFFAAMDDGVHALAVRSVVRFLEEETHPSAAKDTSLLCQAVGAARIGREEDVQSSPGLDALIPVLTDDLSHHSTKTVIYRIRCLAGAVRFAGMGVVKHKSSISQAVDFALSSDDRHLFKTGCKLLRHTLSTLAESYPLSTDTRPRVYASGSDVCPVVLGRSAQLRGDPVQWHVPNSACTLFAAELLETHVARRLDALCCHSPSSDILKSKLLTSMDVQELRRCLRVIRYSVRGGASLFLDNEPLLNAEDFVPYEMSSYRMIGEIDKAARQSLLLLRGRVCSFLIVLSSIIASETLYPDGLSSFSDDDAYRRVLPLISSDPKVCKETCDIALLLLTRRGAFFRSQESRTIWKAQKQVATDFTMCAQADRMIEVMISAEVYGDSAAIMYKDGEDAGKTIPRRLLVARVQLFHISLQRNASFEVPRRLRRIEREKSFSRNILFNVRPSLSETVSFLEEVLQRRDYRPLDAYEGIVDGLFALCCHSNTQVRGSAISVVDYAMTRFGWIVAPRVPRMLSGLALQDSRLHGKFGVPSCAMLLERLNHQGKRKRLAEAVKGVCSILSLTRVVRHMLGSWKMRLSFVETVCGTDRLVSLLPAEEMQKITHYLQAVFTPFRSGFYILPRSSSADRNYHDSCLAFILNILAEKKSDNGGETDVDSNEKRVAHWRKLLMASWFLLVFVEAEDVREGSKFSARIWSTCFHIMENEAGQPLQRVALGLLGKLVSLCCPSGGVLALKEKMADPRFCKVLGKALVYDHKEDTSVGDGHDAQWSSGVENILRDAARHLAPKTLFPFQRTSQSLGSFKIAHAQLVELLISCLDSETAALCARNMLDFSKELSAAPPSEDQRNQQITSGEIFAGIYGSFIRSTTLNDPAWSHTLLLHIDEAMTKIPFSLLGAYFDAIRYALQFSSSESFHPLTTWLIDKIQSTLWQPNGVGDVGDALANSGPNGSSSQGTDGFTAQSKWLYLVSAVIIEMDETEADDQLSGPAWFMSQLTSEEPTPYNGASQQRERSWQLVTQALLPRLTSALGHPFDSCRDHIARCLCRICYSHRKMVRTSASRAPSRSGSNLDLASLASGQVDPGLFVVEKLASLERDYSLSYKNRYNALSTARRFISYCVHLGEAKFEYSDYVIPLLPLAFEALSATSDDSAADSPTNNQDDGAAKRALEAEVIKGYRGMISEVSVTAVISYGRAIDVTRVLDVVQRASRHEKWQVRHASANFLRCFEGAHKFLFRQENSERTTLIVTDLLADERREVSSAAMAALTGILAASSPDDVAKMVKKYSHMAAQSKMKKGRKGVPGKSYAGDDDFLDKEKRRGQSQQVSIFFLCATIMACPYDTPAYVPVALAAISKHSFEKNAPLGVRDTVKKCCAEYKRTHMSDNWEIHRNMFSQVQLEAFEDVVSTPHYYA